MALLGAFRILAPRCFAAGSAAFVRSEITLVVFGNGHYALK
jgi:hypothetical protein